MFYIKLTSFSDYSLEEREMVCLNQVLTVLYVTDSPLSDSNIAEMQWFI